MAMMNMVAKKPNDTMNPTAESTASFRWLCTSFSNTFIVFPLLVQSFLV
ncbi:hypothetical protein I656_02604 [Geobacillus sp. WSUCF1]|nr:hypothetical protein I656_02604 [Geobacillus sp. WSUCF1]